MKHAIIVQHVPFEGPGHLAPLLREAGYRSTVYHPPRDEVSTIDPADLDLLVLLGGPMSANDHVHDHAMYEVLQLARIALERGVPMLGICLGAQVMALAAGGEVVPMARKEIGLHPLTLTAQGQASPLRHIDAAQPVLHWHGEQIRLPPRAKRLAQTAQAEVQAFMPAPRALGLQFHLEAELDHLDEWTAPYADELRVAGIAPAPLLEQAAREAPALRATGRAVLGEWLRSLQA